MLADLPPGRILDVACGAGASDSFGSLPHLDFWRDEINEGEARSLLRVNPMICTRPIQRGLAPS